MLETCQQLQGMSPSWASQGHAFATQAKRWEEIANNKSLINPKEIEERFFESESRTLSELYDAKSQDPIIGAMSGPSNPISREIIERCKDFAPISTSGAGIQEEQEIELVQQKEAEREVERPPPATPAKHRLHKDVESFITTGEFDSTSTAFCSAAMSLSKTSLVPPKGTDDTFENLLVTKDFADTILKRTIVKDKKHDELQNEFLRSVEWVVSNHSHTPSVFVILSPFEVNELLPVIRETSAVTLHVYAARSSGTMRIITEPLRFSLPISSTPVTWSGRLPRILDLYAGTLYLPDYQTYKAICATLRLYFEQPDDPTSPKPSEDMAGGINSYGFVKCPSMQKRLELTGPGFEDNPIPFLRHLIFLRRYGRSFLPSHMGQLLHGRALSKSRF
jgi:hypothetical protein